MVQAPTWSGTDDDDSATASVMVNRVRRDWGWGARLGLMAQVGGFGEQVPGTRLHAHPSNKNDYVVFIVCEGVGTQGVPARASW